MRSLKSISSVVLVGLAALAVASCSGSGSTDQSGTGDPNGGNGDVAANLGDSKGDAKSDATVKDGDPVDNGTALDQIDDTAINDQGPPPEDVAVVGCKVDGDCDGQVQNLDSCQAATCDVATGQCVATNIPNGTTCGGANACLEGKQVCLNGKCAGGTPIPCDDNNPCTSDTCDPKHGCDNTNDDSLSCDDGVACTTGDKCAAGKCAGDASKCAGKETNCSDKIDDDGDNAIDCADNDCASDPACAALPKETACNDKIDDDKDGKMDCADSDCSADPACVAASKETNCTDKIDDDKDGAVDCNDNDCAGDPACAVPTKEGNCIDKIDEDKDGATDCADSDCSVDIACAVAKEINCTDKVDNDKDGATDCGDNDCAADLACAATGEKDCVNKLDDDKDGKIDCADSDCANNVACAPAVEAICTDNVDNDKDGKTDCNDLDCNKDVACKTKCAHDLCIEGAKVDAACDACASAVCKADSFCCGDSWDGTCVGEVATICGKQCPGAVEALCADKLDNDKDGKIDCADSDCAKDPACQNANCSAVSVLTCGGADTKSNDAVGSTKKVDAYDCADGKESGETGSEFAYEFVAECDGDVTATVLKSSPKSGYLDLFILDGSVACSGTKCLAHALMGTDSASKAWKAVKGQKYYVVVDGFNGYVSDYTVKITCGCGGGKELNCTDKLDNDADGKIDCADADCVADLACAPTVETNCTDKVDNDKDGKLDCLDPDCVKDPACVAVVVELDCADKVDNDKDGKTDCADSDCAKAVNCIAVVEANCTDKLDNDKDGKIDCADTDCTNKAGCICVADKVLVSGVLETWKNNGVGSTKIVNDYTCTDGAQGNESGSEYTYSYTADCEGDLTLTLTKTSVTAGFLDLFILDAGKVCAGTSCIAHSLMGTTTATKTMPVTKGKKLLVVVDGFNAYAGSFNIKAVCTPKETKCGNKIDDDGDKLIDCDDKDCALDPLCKLPPEAVCTDKVDNDKDGTTDCADTDCAKDVACLTPKTETSCTDKVDNDKDGKLDCADSDCALDVACICKEDYALTCGAGDSYANNNAGSTKFVDSYACNNTSYGNETGNEYVYGYTPDCDGKVTVTITKAGSASQFLDLFVLDAAKPCGGNACLASGLMSNNKATITFDGKKGVKARVVVDGYNGINSAYTLTSSCACAAAVETLCADKLDNDKDGKIDCLDSDCALDPACAKADNCKADLPMACGGSDSWTSNGVGSTKVVDSYTCDDSPGGPLTGETGNEYTYDFTADCTGTVTVKVTKKNLTDGKFLDLFILDGTKVCAGPSCLAHGLMGSTEVTASVPAKIGQKFWIVVDGFQGYTGGYDFTATCACANVVPETLCNDKLDNDKDGKIDCLDSDCAKDPTCLPETLCADKVDNDKDGKIDCADTDCAKDPACAVASTCKVDLPLTCPDKDSWTSNGAGSTKAIDSYTCADSPGVPVGSETGAEYTYDFTAACNGTATVTVTKKVMSAGTFLDLFILDGNKACVGTSCVAHKLMSGSTATATFAVTKGQKFAIVVDGFSAAAGTYDLTTACTCK